MTDTYTPPKIWTWDSESGGRFANINRPIAGATHDKDLPVGKHVFKFAVMNKANRSGLRVKLFEVEGSAGKAIPINQ